jgi:hypothetical protein
LLNKRKLAHNTYEIENISRKLTAFLRGRMLFFYINVNFSRAHSESHEVYFNSLSSSSSLKVKFLAQAEYADSEVIAFSQAYARMERKDNTVFTSVLSFLWWFSIRLETCCVVRSEPIQKELWLCPHLLGGNL